DGRGGADRDDYAMLDRDACREHAVGRHDAAAVDDEIGLFAHGRTFWSHLQSIAHPPSTGRSMPVICRDTSLARNRQALATSASVEMRLSAYSAAWRSAASATVIPRRLAMSAQTLSRKRGPATIPGATPLTWTF